MIRLDKLLTTRGYCSRREAPSFIRKGVLVGGRPPSSADEKVDPDQVTIENMPVDPGTGIVFMLHKPLGYTCSHEDKGSLVFDLLPPRMNNRNPQVSSVGRLDKDSTGLLLLTDDGPLLHHLTSPRHHLEKIYECTLAEDLRGNEGEIFASGTLMLKGETTPLQAATFRALSPRRASIILTEGRYHQVRRMFAALGNHVMTLHRSQIGPLTLGDLAAGKYRMLTATEIDLLRSSSANVGRAR